MNILILLAIAAAFGLRIELDHNGNLVTETPRTHEVAAVLAKVLQHQEDLVRALSTPAPPEPGPLDGLDGVLRYLAPPLTVLQFLDTTEQRQSLPPTVVAWALRWKRILSNQPVPPLDGLQVSYRRSTAATRSGFEQLGLGNG